MPCLTFIYTHLRRIRWLLFCALGLVNPVQAKDLLFIGNSLTQHGPTSELGWKGNWGMAASSADKDYVHQLATRLEQVQQTKVQITITPGYPLESKFLAEPALVLPVPAGSNYDYIVVQIGDNIDFKNPRADLFAPRYDDLVARLQKALRPTGRLICLGKWWASDAVDAKIRTACERHGGTFLALAHISAKADTHANKERSFTNQGVGEHPGDKGMAEIANQLFCTLIPCVTAAASTRPDVGVYYFPGWYSQSRYWKDIKGLPESRSPNQPWPEREPLLGYYAEEDPKIAIQHIEWASQYGITFFAYDWYWDGKGTYLNHAIDNFRKAPNNTKLKFSLLWANHSDVPRNLAEFDAMVNYWLTNYLTHPQFYCIGGKPVIFVFSNTQLEMDAQKFGWTAQTLLSRADKTVRNHGLPGLFFVATTNAKPTDKIENFLIKQGFSAYSGWNYVAAQDKSPEADYTSMVNTYLDFYSAAVETAGALPYIVPASPGWDSRPWEGAKALVRANSNPEKFQTMLTGARELLNRRKRSVMNILMIEAWNEFGEGAYIEPTKKWQFEYLKSIQNAMQ